MKRIEEYSKILELATSYKNEIVPLILNRLKISGIKYGLFLKDIFGYDPKSADNDTQSLIDAWINDLKEYIK